MAAISPPRRGGDHPIYGIFLGGNELDNDYKLLGSRHYKFTGQRRGPKVVNSIEQTLHSLSNSKDSEKFTGKLETTPSANTNEIDKERFIKLLRKRVRLHGQQSFYAMTYGQAVVPLFDNYHKFTVEEVIEQHKDRCEELCPDFDTNGVETKDSESLRFVAYDDYEFDEFGLSRLVVESLLGDTFLEKIYTRFGNDDDYESYPGQVLFMMALDTYNASVQRDIAGAQAKYNDLSLDLYPGEDVTELATEALRLTNILSGSYALPLTLGTTLIKKSLRLRVNSSIERCLHYSMMLVLWRPNIGSLILLPCRMILIIPHWDLMVFVLNFRTNMGNLLQILTGQHWRPHFLNPTILILIPKMSLKNLSVTNVSSPAIKQMTLSVLFISHEIHRINESLMTKTPLMTLLDFVPKTLGNISNLEISPSLL